LSQKNAHLVDRGEWSPVARCLASRNPFHQSTSIRYGEGKLNIPLRDGEEERAEPNFFFHIFKGSDLRFVKDFMEKVGNHGIPAALPLAENSTAWATNEDVLPPQK
jgi:hypothetical protein